MLTIANCSLETLIAELRIATKQYRGILESVEGTTDPFGSGKFREILTAGSDGGWSFILEPNGAQIALMHDILREISNTTKSTVFSFRAEFGNLEVCKYSSGQLERLFIDRPTAFSEPFSVGAMLDGELPLTSQAVCRPDLNAVLDRLRFSRFRFPDAYVAAAHDIQLGWKIDLAKVLLEGPPCHPSFDEHVCRYQVDRRFYVPRLQIRFDPDQE